VTAGRHTGVSRGPNDIRRNTPVYGGQLPLPLFSAGVHASGSRALCASVPQRSVRSRTEHLVSRAQWAAPDAEQHTVRLCRHTRPHDFPGERTSKTAAAASHLEAAALCGTSAGPEVAPFFPAGWHAPLLAVGARNPARLRFCASLRADFCAATATVPVRCVARSTRDLQMIAPLPRCKMCVPRFELTFIRPTE
jgi:hypothetical protein